MGVRKKDYYNSLPEPERFTWKEQLHIVVHNKPLLLAAGAYGTLFLMMNTINAANIYFYRIALGSTDIIALSGVISLVFSIGVIPFVPGILKKMEKRTMAMLGLGIYLIQPIGYLVMRGTLLAETYQYNSKILMIFLVLTAFGAFGNIVANIAIVAFIMDVADYTEWKFHTGCVCEQRRNPSEEAERFCLHLGRRYRAGGGRLCKLQRCNPAAEVHGSGYLHLAPIRHGHPLLHYAEGLSAAW